MAELRRIYIKPKRLCYVKETDNILNIEPKESHYLRRVLRLQKGNLISIVDGLGNLWEASLESSDCVKLLSSIDDPYIKRIQKKPLVCLAVVIPKKGFDEILRMTCEIGVDLIQPLISKRCISRFTESRDRWLEIIKESMELSERLWMPEIFNIINFDNWLLDISENSINYIATTRQNELPDLHHSLTTSCSEYERIWIVIGPEGGWTEYELSLARNSGFKFITLGESILRTSTAAIIATHDMVLTRKTN